MTIQELSNNEIEEALDRYNDLYTEALGKFDGATMNSILKLWEEVENEAIARGLIEKVDA
jgi:hypothetical protein